MRFLGTVELGGKTATGIEVPDDIVSALGSGRRPAVTITIGGHSYRTTVAVMGGPFLVPLSAENRTAAGIAAGDRVEVDIELDTAVREVELPDDLVEALRDEAEARRFFDGLAFTHRKEWARWITEAKRPETRASRIEKMLGALREGRRTR
jgi:hypothetical protein